MRDTELRTRTKQFALRVIRMYGRLPKDAVSQTLGKQALRSGTSVAANFREATRARSTAEFLSELGVVEQELGETSLWFELLVESDIVAPRKLSLRMQEADELLRIVVSSIKSKKRRLDG